LFQLTDADQELYKNFPLVVSERWQQEIAETVFEVINQDTDKLEMKRRQKPRVDESEENCELADSAFDNFPYLFFLTVREMCVWFAGTCLKLRTRFNIGVTFHAVQLGPWDFCVIKILL
jgi:hypothetical protein